MEKQFQVNKNIVLKLEDGVTNIYLNGEKFIQCKYLLTTILGEKIETVNNLDSIDEIFSKIDSHSSYAQNIEKYDIKFNKLKYNIPPEAEFWAHCSNIQAWAESGYDTRLLLANLSFPLLKKLTLLGDVQAKKVIKEEIARRIASGYAPVVQYLIMEGYTELLNIEELEVAVRGLEELNLYRCGFESFPDFILKANNIQKLVLTDNKISEIPEDIKELTLLEEINFSYNELSVIPSSIGELKSLKKLNLNKNSIINLPTTIGNLKNLRSLKLSINILNILPESIGSLTCLKKLYLDNNKIYRLPISFGNLSSLKKLNLSVNRFKSFPESVSNILSLENLNLSNNQMEKIPPSITKLSNIKHLNLSQNKLEMLPDNIGVLKNLVSFSISGNSLIRLPETIKDLKFLEQLHINDNKFDEIPDFLGDTKSLKEVTIENSQIELLSEKLKNKLRKQNVRVTVIKVRSIIQQWTSPDLYDSKNKHRTTLYSDNSWTCTCPHQHFKNYLKLMVDCDHILKYKKKLKK